MDGIFKNILFNVKLSKGIHEALDVEVKILYNNDYDKDIEFELMFYYDDKKIIFDEQMWNNFINDYENNISKKINPTHNVPFGYQGYKFKFNCFRFKHYEFNKFTGKIEQYILPRYKGYSIDIKNINDKNFLIAKLNELKNQIKDIIFPIQNSALEM
jgi:hypothetical protein